jgi:hypothetical protein
MNSRSGVTSGISEQNLKLRQAFEHRVDLDQIAAVGSQRNTLQNGAMDR